MKRPFYLFLLPLLSLLARPAHAQFGAKAGLNAAILDGQRADLNAKYNYSWHGGVFYNYNLLGPISLRPELLYSMQGSEFKSMDENFDTRLHYLTLPVLLNVKISRLNLQAGPMFGLLLRAEEDGRQLIGYSMTGDPQYGSVNQQITDQYKRGDFGLCAGLEYRLAAGFRVGGRFNAGLVDVNDYSGLRRLNDVQLQNRVFQLYAAYQLGTNE